jgi:hypothetical protein
VSHRIRNWHRFQHYKHRNPPWVKLYVELLSSKDWVTLDDASRVLAVACILLASKNEGLIPDDLQYIKRVAFLNSFPDINPLKECGFLEEVDIESDGDASALLAEREQSASNLRTNAIPETEKSKRREERSARARDTVDNSKGNGGWWKTEAGIQAKGDELGVRAAPGESWQVYKDRIFEHLNSLKGSKFND